MEDTRHIHTHTDNVFLLLTSQIPRFWPRCLKCPFQGIPNWRFNMTGILINCLRGCHQSLPPYKPPKHIILKQKLSGCYVEYEGCPKESIILIHIPPKTSLFSKSARKMVLLAQEFNFWAIINTGPSSLSHSGHISEEAQMHTLYNTPTMSLTVNINIKDYKWLQDEFRMINLQICINLLSRFTKRHPHGPRIFAEKDSGDLSFLYRHHLCNVIYFGTGLRHSTTI